MDRVFAAGKSFKRNLKLFNRLTCGTADDSPWIAMCAIGVDPQHVVAELKKHGVKTTAQLKKMADTHCKHAMKNEAKFGETGMSKAGNVVLYAYMFCEVHEAFGTWLEEFSGQAQVRLFIYIYIYLAVFRPVMVTKGHFRLQEAAEEDGEDENDTAGLAEGIYMTWESEQFGFDEESMRATIALALRGDAKRLIELTSELGVLEV